ncbi:MAG: hypothetical protein Q9195_003406 [Heterodermia aff. obscurata]
MKKSYNINAVSYLPRQDGNSNGNIGQHQIQLSSDGQVWGSPVVIGTYLDDASLKKSSFVTKPARYVRLIAITEAGNRGPWMSAADINVFAAASYTPPQTSLGKWGPTIDFPIVPAAAAIEHDSGKLLGCGGPGGMTQTCTYDPASGVVSKRTITNTNHDMFCPGLSIDATGRPVVTGGNNAERTSIYDVNADAWIAAANMQISRGYQSQTTLSDGRIFTIGGSWSGGQGNKNGEVYNALSNQWALLSGCPVAPMLTNDAQGVYRADNHAWLFGWKNGSVFQAGPSKAMNWYTTATASGSTRPAGLRGTDADAMCGNSVMYDAVNGKILTAGGSPSYQDSDATTNANVVTIGDVGNTPTVAQVAPMQYARSFANGVVLPNGKVFISGGQARPVPFSDNTAVLAPELFDPATGKFTTLNPMAIPRTYHSWALLMPDATVYNGGGGLCGTCTTNHFDAEVYSPSYLFNSDGTLATRPKINTVSATAITLGSKLTVTTSSAVTSFSLIRYGSATHTVNTDQRRIPLVPLSGGTNTYTLTMPKDAGIAIPGSWMLFAMNSAGVPSVAKTILVKSA